MTPGPAAIRAVHICNRRLGPHLRCTDGRGRCVLGIGRRRPSLAAGSSEWTDDPTVFRGVPAGIRVHRRGTGRPAAAHSPDDEYRAIVPLNDYTRAREANGIAPPRGECPQEDLERYLQAVSAAGVAYGPWISGFTEYAVAQLGFREYLGFEIRDMERSALVGEDLKLLEADGSPLWTPWS